MKKVLALALAAVMVLALVGAAFADAEFNTPRNNPANFGAAETSISVTGLDSSSDSAYYTQLLTWVGSTDGAASAIDTNGGWALTSNGASLVGSGANCLGTTDAAVLAALLDGIDADEATKIANTFATGGTAMTVSGTTATASSVAVGMYYVRLVANSTDTIYNPVIVSADYFVGNNSVDTSETIGSSAVVKKSKVTFDKQVGHGDEHLYTYNDVAPGDTIPYKITTTIPAYGDQFIDPTFTITDTFSAGIDLYISTDDSCPFTVTYGGNSTSVSNSDVTITATTGTKTFTVDFTDAYLLNDDRGVTAVTITYWGKVNTEAVQKNVNPMDNTATLTYSNKPGVTQDKHDKTRHYDFSIDGALLGHDGVYTSELVKIGLDNEGNMITELTTSYHNNPVSPLAGATFQLTAVAGTGAKIGDGMATTYVTGDDGRIVFHGLDAGVYKLEEVSAPAGFVKDSTPYYVEIVPTYSTSDPDILESYKILFGTSATAGSGDVITTFTMSNDGDVVDASTDATAHDSIANRQGLELPSTGGIGTTIFYVTGLLMVLGAATILVSRRRADAE